MTKKNEICRVSFLRNKNAAKTVAKWRKEWPQTEFCRNPRHAMRKRPFGADILLVGTTFQCLVWRALAKIPSGKTKTYGDVAQQIGKAKAVRAVGGACGVNPVPFFIPCHRVVAAKGLGGFSAGLEIKKMFLKKEHASIL